MNDFFYNVEIVSYWPICLTLFLCFLEQSKRNGCEQTTAMSSITNKRVRAKIVSQSKPLSQGSNPPQTDPQQEVKPIGSNFDEEKIKGAINLAASDDKFALFAGPNYKKLVTLHPKN